MQTEQLLCYSGMTDAEHSRASGSNEGGLSIPPNISMRQYHHGKLLEIINSENNSKE